MFVCSDDNFKCAMRYCVKCKNINQKLKRLLKFDKKEVIVLNQWGNAEKKVQKVDMEFNATQCITYIEKELKNFIFHSYVVKIQLRCYDEARKNRREKKLIVVLDFSEKFRPKTQHEIQSGHYSYELVTLLTGAMYFPFGNNFNDVMTDQETFEVENSEHSESDHENVERDEADDECIIEKDLLENPLTFGIITDCKEQDKFTVFSMIQEIIQYGKTLAPHIDEIELWTDGAPTQFKNRYSLATIPLLEKEFELKIKWNFFPTSHGKTIADGVGGNLKNMVDRLIATQNIQISSALNFFNVLNTINTPIQLMFVSQDQIDKDKIILKNKWAMDDSKPSKDNLKQIKDCRMCHSFQSGGEGMLICAITSLGSGENLHKIY